MPGIVILCGLHTSCYLPITIKSCGITISILQMMKQRFGEFKVLAHVLIPIRQNYDSPLGMTGFGAQVLTHHSVILTYEMGPKGQKEGAWLTAFVLVPTLRKWKHRGGKGQGQERPSDPAALAKKKQGDKIGKEANIAQEVGLQALNIKLKTVNLT